MDTTEATCNYNGKEIPIIDHIISRSQYHLDEIMEECLWMNDTCTITIEYGDYARKSVTRLTYEHYRDMDDRQTARLISKERISSI